MKFNCSSTLVMSYTIWSEIKSLYNEFPIPFSGLSLKTQELTALFVAARLCCSTLTEANIHTVLDLISLSSTLVVIWMIRFKLKSSYIKELDNTKLYFVVNILSCSLCCVNLEHSLKLCTFAFNEYMVYQFEYIAFTWFKFVSLTWKY